MYATQRQRNHSCGCPDSEKKLVPYLLTGMAGSSLLALAGIVIFLFMEGLPLFAHYPVMDFLFGRLWYPTEDPGLFGIFPLLAASLAVTFFSSLLAVPLGVLTAVYLTEIAHPADAPCHQALCGTSGSPAVGGAGLSMQGLCATIPLAIVCVAAK